MTADERTQDEGNFFAIGNKRRRLWKQIPIDNVRAIIISINPRTSHIQFATKLR